MSTRDYYKVTYTNDSAKVSDSSDILDNDTEFNANQFKLYDDFTTDLRINYNPLRSNYHNHGIVRTEVRNEGKRRVGDPNDSGVDMENGNPLDEVTASKDGDLVSCSKLG